MLVKYLNRTKKLVGEKINSSIGSNNNIEKAMLYSASADSKMIRAGLVFASAESNKFIKESTVITLSTAVELMHTYSLIHDDLPAMDNDDFRRGKKSNHIVYGEANAILAGDALQSLAYQLICNDKNLLSDEKVKAIKNISEACGKNGMVYGQYLDIKNENNISNVDEKMIDKIHNLKTGKLIECCVILGQIGNRTDKNLEKILKGFGSKIGLAFQIKDDLLDITSSKKTLGKSTFSDIKNNKASYTNILSIEKIEKKLSKIVESAIDDIKKLNNNNFEMLIDIAKYIKNRDS